MAEKVNNKMEYRMIKEQHLVLLASIEVDPSLIYLLKVPTVTELFSSADGDFFYSVKINSTHVLQPYLPDQTDTPYCLRTCPTT